MHLFPVAPEDYGTLSVDELLAFIRESQDAARAVAADPESHLAEGETAEDLVAIMRTGVENLEAAKAELDSRETEEPEPAADPIAELAARAADAGEFAAEADPEDDDPEEEDDDPDEVEAAAAAEALAVEPEVEPEPAAEPAVATASGRKPAARKPLPRPPRARAAARTVEEPEPTRIAFTAAAENLGFGLGDELPDPNDLAMMMIRRRKQFGHIAKGTKEEKLPMARAEWGHLYPAERQLVADEVLNMALVAAVTRPEVLRREMDKRRQLGVDQALTASGGLCAPVTPYYALQMISQAMRPVRAALPSFSADRGGIRFAAPASLGAIDDAVGIITEAEDSAGGTGSVKSCQIIDCPEFSEVDVSTIFHCIQFGTLGARTFPELVAQWNSLVMAAHARLAETALLDGISSASTAVTAGDLGLGASANLLSQILTAAAGMRSRHRMDPEAVLRILLPDWVESLFISDVYRSQFQRFDMTEAQFVALLRQANVEPTFYLDGATGSGQVFGAQAAGDLNAFPTTVVWYLYPEGSFLYLDGGTLELGLVRDSVLNETNDWQIFGETFENVAGIGVESLEVTSTLCDSGVVASPVDVTCPIDYAA